MSHEEQVESNLSEAKDLVIQQTPQLENESEVPRVGEECLLLPLAVDGRWGNGLCCVMMCMHLLVVGLLHYLHG